MSDSIHWRLFSEESPEYQRVLVTNNPDVARARNGTSHVWIGWPQESPDGWIIYTEDLRKVYNLIAWCPIPMEGL